MSEWLETQLAAVSELRISNVDKKSKPGEKHVQLCNYMDVYSNEYVRSDIAFMESTASSVEIEKFRVQKDDVLITKDSETPFDIGIPAVVVDDIATLVCGYHLALIRPKTAIANPVYLSKFLGSDFTQSYFARMAAGSTRYGLSSGSIKKTPLRLPSIKHQAKIANILQTIDDAIERTEALIEKYGLIKTGMMHDLFTRGLTSDGKLRPPREEAPDLYKETPIGWIPKDWDDLQIADLANPQKGSTVIGPFGSDLVMSDYRTEGVPVIFVRDVKKDRFNWVSEVYVSSSKAQKLFSHRANPGDLLITKMGLPPCVSCMYPAGHPMAIITADMIRMTVDKAKCDPEWLSAAINHDRCARQIASITAGVTRPKVTLSDFRTLKIAVPSPPEQKLITRVFSRQQELINAERDKGEKLCLQKSGLMHDLLTGKVPVNLDEPQVGHV